MFQYPAVAFDVAALDLVPGSIAAPGRNEHCAAARNL
jgi:hypothetical protein